MNLKFFTFLKYWVGKEMGNETKHDIGMAVFDWLAAENEPTTTHSTPTSCSLRGGDELVRFKIDLKQNTACL